MTQSPQESAGPASAHLPEWPLIDAFQADPCPAGLPILQGVPLPAGRVRDPLQLRLTDPGGEDRPVSARSLADWPDGSIRWALVAFGAKTPGRHVLSWRLGGQQGEPSLSPEHAPQPDQPVRLEQGGRRTGLSNGLVRLSLAHEGPGPIESLVAHGHAFLEHPEAFRLVADEANTQHEPKRSLSVLEINPVRGRLRVEGTHTTRTNQASLSYRLDVELWAGWPCVRLDYQFFHLAPGQPGLEVDRISAEFDLNLAPHASARRFVQSAYGLPQAPRLVSNPAAVALRADETRGSVHAESPEMLRDETEYPLHFHAPMLASEDWLAVVDERFGLCLGMRDFASMRPKRLHSIRSSLNLDVWPRFAGPLEIPQGFSRRVSMNLGLMSQPLPEEAKAMRRLIEALRYEGRSAVDPAWFIRCQALGADRLLPSGVQPRVENHLRRLTRLELPGGMIDLGDTPDTELSRKWIAQRPEAVPPRPERPASVGSTRRGPSTPPTRVFTAEGDRLIGWAALEAYTPLWSNNQGDALLAFCLEALRRGRPEPMDTARLLARHCLEVDFVHYHDLPRLHRGLVGPCRHHTDPTAPPSFEGVPGLIAYHLLSGDADAREVFEAVGQQITDHFASPDYRQATAPLSPRMGQAVRSLCALVRFFEDPLMAQRLEELIEIAVQAQPASIAETHLLRGVLREPGIVSGVEDYLALEQREQVGQWFDELLGHLLGGVSRIAQEPEPLGPMTPELMAIGYERTGREAFIEQGLAALQRAMDEPHWHAPLPEARPAAVRYRGLIRFLGHAHRLGRLTGPGFDPVGGWPT